MPTFAEGVSGEKTKEARLVKRDVKAFLKITKKLKGRAEEKGSVAVDINLNEIVVGKPTTL
ncbi:hypothetical protein B9Q09_04270 [Candidatus Marsarchaeota G2 archaeon ECH_B_SAG-C16]|uniref:Transposase n=5 Tax=Candidatus Marsarchaeota group 2 TaxID=2203771 RepID=A0A2R6CEH1_9ARCH|nr:MAG: hypothetical protein B9Q09_04270 [Candidatus Marsarchaeota G2 archaeon ECH_B_SAG-C16]PSN95051.1 MAG: hypothetical protein B9Q06_07005 [Candidatus Marsarchaeota G2 archaeon ECH_B_2]PSN99593.1 MAG: hypothetical protein B9Q07_06410 [Candidatus Marsarchaeota G2 archaeon ECH_B_3]PSO01897.1 MAG: hypothetical protein B9Q05_07105 [Candidatus Marsarchaeota G2 archaeon ECH_B_1]PSO09190.1 MAG: hypothetical protein B9Q04_01615 [Candidatus Marsarchaeota G2 archaeon BE_D]